MRTSELTEGAGAVKITLIDLSFLLTSNRHPGLARIPSAADNVAWIDLLELK